MPSVEMAKKKSKKAPETSSEDTIETQHDVAEADTDKDQEMTDSLTPVQRKTKWQKFKRAVSRKMSVKKKKKGTEVEEVNIVQEDDTDYDKQWSRKLNRPGSRWNDTESGDYSRGSSPGKDDGADLPEDGIMVIHDADEDDDL